MLDLGMLDLIARRGGGSWLGKDRLPFINEVFARVVRDGWAPRSPAFGDELERLDRSYTRGTCIEPLILAGDEVYIDREMPPQPGDLVSFALSSRGADAQNSGLPAGQSRWSAGDRWIKLYAKYGGTEMLFDKYGSSATATLMTCESPDHTPVLYPVRNIRRHGRLLFTPDHYGSQIGLNAATTTTTAYNGSHTTAAVFGADTTWLTITTAAQPVDHTIQVTSSMDVWKAAGSPQRQVELFAAPLAGGPPFYGSPARDILSTSSPGERIALQADFPALAGTQYIVRVALSAPGGGSGAV
ncbi:MAG TPA: hypothetical protein VG963_08680, partial [Polyangiaceae bacterium]|nr:hypothetical protein [Polyangiaceae bacterium]